MWCKLNKILILIFMGVALSMSLESCSRESETIVPEPEPAGPGFYLRLRLSIEGVTRSNPSGGENGDGLEDGVRHENDIENVALFFYNHSLGLNAPAEAPISHREVYYGDTFTPAADGTVSRVVRVSDYEFTAGDRVVVVLNYGASIKSVSTLGELREMIVDSPWRESASLMDYAGFVMATASDKTPYDGKIHFTDENDSPLEGTHENPFYMMAEVERVAARIDFMFNVANLSSSDEGELAYAVNSEAETSGDAGTLYLSHILPVNSMREGTTLLKHVSDGPDMDKLIVCGDELTDASVPLNYVVDPHSVLKEDASDEDISSWYGFTSSKYIRNNGETVFTAANHLRNWLSMPGLVADCSDGWDKSLTLSYVNENTQHKGQHDSRFMTGLVFRGIFHPKQVYVDAHGNPDTGYQRGDTFWRYSPTSSDMKGKNLYFSSAEAAEEYKSAHPEDLSEIVEYRRGVCYYNLWIRHANVDRNIGEGDAYESWPMEYGIVRNNIYRIGVSFTGIGYSQPEIREPLNIRSRIFVRKWNFRRQPTIIM